MITTPAEAIEAAALTADEFIEVYASIGATQKGAMLSRTFGMILAAETIASRIRAIPVASPWQSMDSAPRDGTEILVWGVGLERVALVRFYDDHWGTGFWYVTEPLFWLPTPPPPTQEATE